MTTKPTFRDWALAAISTAFLLAGVAILPSNLNLGISTIALFGGCWLVAVGHLRRKLRYGRMKFNAVEVVDGLRLQPSKTRVAMLGGSLLALGVILLVFSPPGAPLVVRLCYGLMACAGAVILAALVFGFIPHRSLEFQPEGLIFAHRKWSALLPWRSITHVDHSEMHGNPVLLMWLDAPETLAVSPPEQQPAFMQYVQQCRNWVGADISLTMTHYGVDLPVLVAAIQQYRERHAGIFSTLQTFTGEPPALH